MKQVSTNRGDRGRRHRAQLFIHKQALPRRARRTTEAPNGVDPRGSPCPPWLNFFRVLHLEQVSHSARGIVPLYTQGITKDANISPDIASSVSSRHRRRGSRRHSAPVGQPGLRLSVAERPPGLRDHRPAESRLGDHQQVVQVRRFRRPGRRRCERAGRQRRKGGEEPRQEARRLQGLPQDPRSQRHRRGHDRHAGPLAHEDRGRSDARRQRRLLRKAAHADDRRRQADREGRQGDRPRLSGRHDAANRVRPAFPAGDRADQKWPHRHREESDVRHQRHGGLAGHSRRSPFPKDSTGTSGSGRRRRFRIGPCRKCEKATAAACRCTATATTPSATGTSTPAES